VLTEVNRNKSRAREAVQVTCNFSPKWAGSSEEYADYGPLRQIYSAHDRWHQVWAGLNHGGKYVNIETGIGFGLTAAFDRRR